MCSPLAQAEHHQPQECRTTEEYHEGRSHAQGRAEANPDEQTRACAVRDQYAFKHTVDQARDRAPAP